MNHFPIIEFDALWHVGTFNPAHKRKGSLEGAGLSISRHPDEWTHIAKLGGNPVWELRKPGHALLNALQISAKGKQIILAWALSQGLIEACTLWEWSRYDDELDTTLTGTYTNEAEAFADASFDGETDGTIREVSGHRALPRLLEKTLQSAAVEGTSFIFDLLLPVYAEEVLGIDGVWWDEELDPCCYSAPRGVISLSALPTWSSVRLTDDCLAA